MSDQNIKIEYKEKYVAYLDVLGFKEKLKGSVADLECYFNTVIKELAFLKSLDSKRPLEYLLMSDAIIITFPVGQNALESLTELLIAISKIQYTLCKKGIWLRGAVSYGKIFLNDKHSVVVGPALVNAYLLEALAVNPRVIVDPKIIDFIGTDRTEFVRKINAIGKIGQLNGYVLYEDKNSGWHSEFLKDALFVDYLDILNTAVSTDHAEFLVSLRKSAYSDQRSFPKFRWVIEYATCTLRGGLADPDSVLLKEILKI
ncbi:hypothetical protein ACES2I_08755 [Bdellovibrio bacteriovorus]|uniref:hypothetical protein n=1 Tax=Bdellovibrio bacteriovorus TaxID=959 RepID=UPI0035A68A82